MERKFKVGDIVKMKVEVRFGKFLFSKEGDRFKILEVYHDDGMMDYSGLNLEERREKWELGLSEEELVK